MSPRSPKAKRRSSQVTLRLDQLSMLIRISTLLSLVGQTFARTEPKHPGTILSCVDSTCNKCTTGNDGTSGLPPNTWQINAGYPQCGVYESAMFKGAEAKSGSGYDVHWSIDQPAPGCHILIMSPVAQDTSGPNCGDVVLEAKTAGCYYTHLDETFMTQYCCGAGDCSKAEPQAGAHKRGVGAGFKMVLPGGAKPIASFSLEDKRPHHVRRDNMSVVPDETAATPGTELQVRAPGPGPCFKKCKDCDGKKVCCPGPRVCPKKPSPSAPPPPPPPPACVNTQNSGEPFTRAGVQTQMTAIVTCNGNNPCSQPISQAVSVAHSLTSQTTHSYTTSAGISIGVKAGIDFIVDGEVTVTGSVDFSKGIDHAIGNTDTTTKTTTITHTIGQDPGTQGFITFTPTLNCQNLTMTCYGDPLAVTKCDPAVLASSDQNGRWGFTEVSAGA